MSASESPSHLQGLEIGPSALGKPEISSGQIGTTQGLEETSPSCPFFVGATSVGPHPSTLVARGCSQSAGPSDGNKIWQKLRSNET